MKVREGEREEEGEKEPGSQLMGQNRLKKTDNLCVWLRPAFTLVWF